MATRRRRLPRTIADIGEFGFLKRLLATLPVETGTVVGPGDDCAVVRFAGRRLLVTVDSMVEGVHYDARWCTPRQLGSKAFLVNASDIAAMGGRPRYALVSIAAPPVYRVRDLLGLHDGIMEAAAACGASIVGGNLTRSAQMVVSITLLGEAPRRLVTRRGARAGDRLYVTGTLGDAALAVRALVAGGAPPRSALQRLLAPTPRLRAGRVLVERGLVSAMIDVSDGLLQDLGHICGASGVGAAVDAGALPLSRAYRRVAGADSSLALSGGEDYELLCTVPERHVSRLEHSRRQLDCPITCIGEITAGGGIRVAGTPAAGIRPPGYDHFGAGVR
jgi:thiamine-monophosphate kinase